MERTAMKTRFLSFTILIAMAHCALAAGQKAPPPPQRAIPDEVIEKLSRSEIVATVKHLIELSQQQQRVIEQQKNDLASATGAQTGAFNAIASSLTEMTELQKQINGLAQHDASVTAKLNTAEKSLWWYRLHWWGAWIALALGVAACLFFYGAKLLAWIIAKSAPVAAKL
jgi:small-conductance mechanosensitive channel